MPESEGPTRRAFFHEVLFADKTRRTRLFDDYTPGSYHVDKLDLASGLAAEAECAGVRLRGLVVLGPAGPLWQYHVVAFIDEGDHVRVTSLVMPHARITGKGASTATVETVDQVLRTMTSSPLVHSGEAPRVSGALDQEFSYELLIARYTAQAPELWHAKLMGADDAQVDQLLEPINQVIGANTTTYGK
jgi:hypothetical protein